MKEAKGEPDMVEALGSIQQIIMKPEWKELVQDVMDNEAVTGKTHEMVLAVANAIVTPLSLLIYAAKLPADHVNECQMLWKEALKRIGAKCSPNEHEKEIPTPEKQESEADLGSPVNKSAKRRLSFQDQIQDEQDETDLNEGFVGSAQDMRSNEEIGSVGVPGDNDDGPPSEFSTETETSPTKPPEIDQLDKASKSENRGERGNKILASFAAKKGLVTNKTFHQRNRQVISWMSEFVLKLIVCLEQWSTSGGVR